MSAAPDWFTHAIQTPSRSCHADVDGTTVHYLAWNEEERHKPGLILAHGFRAHARWWSFIAPFLTERFRVVALDFSYMGDSGSPARERYSFTPDIVGVIKHAGLGKATLVGHSFGGGRVVRLCDEQPEYVDRAVIIDSYIAVPEIERKPAPGWAVKPKKIYPTLDAALARFRLVPEHNCAEAYVIDYIARHSLKQVPGGWTWKFDDGFKPQPGEWESHESLARIALPLTFLRGELSVGVTEQHAAAMMKYVRNGRGFISIPAAHHHVMLDQPLALVAALRGVLW
jgi:pimeloyl-ACP methyl ester carboxylesterase